MIGAATEKLRDLKPVRTRGTHNKLEEAAQGKPSAKYWPTRVVVDAALRRVGKEQTRRSQNCKYLR